VEALSILTCERLSVVTSVRGSDHGMWTLLLLAATMRSFAHMPLGISDRNTYNAIILLRHMHSYVSVHPHQVNYFLLTVDTLIRNISDAFAERCASSTNFYIHSLQLSDAFLQISIFSRYVWLLHDDHKCTTLVTGALFQCLFLFSIDCVKQLTPALWRVVHKYFCILIFFQLTPY